MDDTTVENAATPGAPAVGLGLRLAPAGDEAQPPSTPPPGQRSAAPAVVLEIEAQTTPEDKDRFSGLAELRTPPHARGHLGDSPSGLLAVDAFPRPPQSPRSPRSPLRDHTPIHAHESHEHVAVVLPEEDLMVPAVIVDPADPIQPHPVATDTAFFHEIHEDPIQTANPTSPFPRSPRRSPLSSPQRHRSPISSPGPGHSPSPTSKIAWKIHNHHLLVGDREQQQQAHSAIISPTQLEAGLTELLARTSLGPHADEDEHRVSGKPHQLAECGTPDSETTNVVDGFSHSLSRTDTLEVLKVEPVKKDSGIDLVEEEEEKPSLVSPPAVNEQKQHIPRFFFGSHDEIQSAMSDDLKKRWAERNQEAQEIIASLFTSEESAEIDTLTEPSSLLPFTVNILALPRYFNSSCWRLAESETKLLEQSKTGVTRKGLEAAWQTLRKACGRSLFYETVKDDGASFADSRAGEQIIGDIETVAFYVTMDPDRLRTCDGKQTRRRSCPEKSNWVGWDDLELVINDVVKNHPGLDFLQPLPIFQERYKDTVLARLMYLKTDFWDGRMTLRQFKTTNFVRMVADLEENAELASSGQAAVGGVGDVNTTRDIFSYKHFYVIYCRFWELDSDHDMVISGKELLRYDLGRLTRGAVKRVVEALGRFLKSTGGSDAKVKMEDVRAMERNWFRSLSSEFDADDAWQDAKLEYRDFVWIVLLVEDKSAPSAISFWFRVLDTDDDGVISLHELRGFWEEQIKRMREGRTGMPDARNPNMVPGYWSGEIWDWPDFICNLLDLSHLGASPCEGLLSSELPPLCDPEDYDQSYIHVTLPALRASNHAAHFYDLVFDLRSYDVHQRRMEPAFREADDVWVCDEDGNRKFKLRGWEKFSERQYEILANEERLAAQQQARAQQRQAQEKRNTRRLLFNGDEDSKRQAGDDSSDESSLKDEEMSTTARRTRVSR